MPDILFTQYLRPHGRPASVLIDRPTAVAEKAERIRKAGYRLECEILQDGSVSLTISDRDEDLAIELVPNGSGVPAAVDRLIMWFDLKE